jgi:prepilin-type N-terminal cleavage/methylation domain-containing protein
MTPCRGPSRGCKGLTLLEVLVALIVLSLVGLSALQLVHQSHGLASNARRWSDAVAYAQDAMEEAKLGALPSGDALPGGYRRQVTRQPWQPGFDRITITVFLPGGGQFDLHRLVHISQDPTNPGDLW